MRTKNSYFVFSKRYQENFIWHADVKVPVRYRILILLEASSYFIVIRGSVPTEWWDENIERQKVIEYYIDSF